MVDTVERQCKSDAEAGEHWLSDRLPPADMALLARQGFVSRERLPSGVLCAKLRFRDDDGRQRVVYLGVDVRRAEQVAAHLAESQAAVRSRRLSERLHRRGQHLLRSIKPRLAPHLNSSEWHFHGRQLRRKRRCAGEGHAIPTPPLKKGHPMHLHDPRDQHQPSDQSAEFALFGSFSGSPFDSMRQWAEQQASPFEKALGLVTADVCDLTVKVANFLKNEFRANPSALVESDGVAENMHFYLQLARQTERNIKMVSEPRAKNRPVDTYARWAQAERQSPPADSSDEPRFAGPPSN